MKFVPDSVLDYTRWGMKIGDEENVFITCEVSSKKEVKKLIYPLVPIFMRLESGEYDALVIFRKYVVFYKDKLCGLCDRNGDEILPRFYQEIFVDDELGLCEITNVFPNGNGANITKSGVYSIEKRKFILPVEYEATHLYDNVITVKKSDLWGIIDFDGKIVVPLEYDDVWTDEPTLPAYITQRNNLFYAFDLSGKKIPIGECNNYAKALSKVSEIIKISKSQ